VVSFNIEFGRHMDSALVVLTAERDLAGADVILLQEVDEAGTRRLADALGMAFVYYPATLRERTDRNFGNAVLSRWPIVDDAKLLLPHIGAVGRSLRTATAATIQMGRTPIRVYSLHLAMPLNQALRDRQDQMLAILRDAAAYPRVIIGGDTNSPGMGHLAVERGYAWPTRHGPDTGFIGRLDHIFFKGLVPPPESAAGTVRDNRGASDHLPVWARGIVY
jgi:endonuclease/exonuclease/phosphatase family metal-dependent hydrolase